MATDGGGTAALELKPRGILDLMDTTVRLYRRHFSHLLSVPAVVLVPLAVLQIVSQYVQSLALGAFGPDGTPDFSPETMGPLMIGGGLTCLTIIVAAALGPLANGALTIAISEKYLGRHVGVKEAYQRALPRWGSLFLVGIVYGLLIGVAATVGVLVAGVAAGLGGYAGGAGGAVLAAVGIGVGGLGALALVFLFMTLFIFYIQAIVIEDVRGIDSLQRSRDLVRGLGWHAFGALVLTGVALGVVWLVVLIPLQILTVWVTGSYPHLLPVWTVVTSCFTSTVQVLLAPVFMTLQTLLYYDLRIRQEGFDLHMMAATLYPDGTVTVPPAFGGTTPPPASPMARPMPPPITAPPGPPPVPPGEVDPEPQAPPDDTPGPAPPPPILPPPIPPSPPPDE